MLSRWDLVTRLELEDLADLFDWHLTEAELMFGLPRGLVESWIGQYRREPLAPLGIPFRPMESDDPNFVVRMADVVCKGLFRDVFPNHAFETILQLDFDAMEPCLPTYRAPAWLRPMFWHSHCLDLIGAVMQDRDLFRKFRLPCPPRTPEDADRRYWELAAAGGQPVNVVRLVTAAVNDNAV